MRKFGLMDEVVGRRGTEFEVRSLCGVRFQSDAKVFWLDIAMHKPAQKKQHK